MALKGTKQTPEHIQKRMLGRASWRKSYHRRGVVLSQETKDKISSSKKTSTETVKGEGHHNWKGGVVKLHNKLRSSPYYVTWRNAVYARDRWNCQKCGVHCAKGNSVAHHVEDFANNLEQRFEVLNGETLCRKCHINHHRKDDPIRDYFTKHFITIV